MTKPPILKAPELIAATPYLLGFTPHDAVVMFGISDRGMLTGTVHLSRDVLARKDLANAAARAAATLATNAATHVMIAAFEDHPEATAEGRDTIGWTATLEDLTVGQIWVATDGTARRVDGPHSSAPVALPAPERSAFITHLIAEGSAPAEDRDTAAAAWVPTGAVQAADQADPTDIGRAWTRLLDGQALTDEDLATAAAGVQRPLTRDALLGTIAGGQFAPDQQGITTQAARLPAEALTDRSGHRTECLDHLRRAIVRLQPHAAVPLLAMSAAIAWADHDETTAGLICEITRAITADNSLVGLIATAIEHGVHA